MSNFWGAHHYGPCRTTIGPTEHEGPMLLRQLGDSLSLSSGVILLLGHFGGSEDLGVLPPDRRRLWRLTDRQTTRFVLRHSC